MSEPLIRVIKMISQNLLFGLSVINNPVYLNSILKIVFKLSEPLIRVIKMISLNLLFGFSAISNSVYL